MHWARSKSSRRSPLACPRGRPRGRWGVALGLAALLTGCPEGGTLVDPECYVVGCGTDGGGPEDYCDPTPIFVAKCGDRWCHGGEDGAQPSGGVELISPPAGMTVGQSLYNVEGFYTGAYPGAPPGTCPPTPRDLLIDAANPAESLMLKKVNGTFSCGSLMPSTTSPLTELELACLTDWVSGVAATGGL